MRHYLVNGQPNVPETGQKTWGDLLEALETHAEARGEAVTAVRFDGVDQPSYQRADLRSLALDRIDRIDVETVPRTRLLRSTLGTAGHSLPALAAGACRSAAAFRRGDAAEGHRQLSALLATVRTLVELTMATAAAAGADLAHLPCGGDTGAGVLGAVGVVLDELARSQREGDWVALADGLEYDLAPALLRWTVVFDAMREGCAV
jgi:hypothetical protein